MHSRARCASLRRPMLPGQMQRTRHQARMETTLPVEGCAGCNCVCWKESVSLQACMAPGLRKTAKDEVDRAVGGAAGANQACLVSKGIGTAS